MSFALYSRSISFAFVDFDDPKIVLTNLHLYDQHSLVASTKAIFTSLPREEPLLVRDLSWALNARLFGSRNPLGYHLGNVLLNALVPSLLLWFLWRLTRDPVLSIGVAGLYAILAIRAEPVAWVMGRKDILSSAFILLALNVQLRAGHPPGFTRRALVDVTLLIIAILATLAKINAVTLPLLFILVEVFARHVRGDIPPEARIDPCKAARQMARFLPHLCACALLAHWYYGILDQYGVTRQGPGPLTSEYLAAWLVSLPIVFTTYLRFLVWPFGLSIYYEWPSIGIAPSASDIALAVTFWVLVGFATLLLWRRRRDLLFFWLAFFCLMIPYMGFAYVGIWIANRYLYLSSFCLLAIVGRVGLDLAPVIPSSLRRVATALLIAVALLNGSVALVHQGVFQNSRTLWDYEINLHPPSMLAFVGVTRTYVLRAERVTDPELRRSSVARAEKAIELGRKHLASLELRPTRYRLPELVHGSELYFFEARLRKLLGRPTDERIALVLKSRALLPNNLTYISALVKLYEERAMTRPKDARLEDARLALEYFAEYASTMKRLGTTDMTEFNELARTFRYFPALTDQVAAIRQQLGPQVSSETPMP